jgi:hypothetical protein
MKIERASVRRRTERSAWRAENGAMEATSTASSRIQKHDARLHADFTACSLEELPALCAEFAAFCATTRMHGALLKGGDEDMQRCLAVRDLLKILMLVAPPDFRLALVPATPGSGAIYRKTEAELRVAGLNARFFESEALAAQWFGS